MLDRKQRVAMDSFVSTLESTSLQTGPVFGPYLPTVPGADPGILVRGGVDFFFQRLWVRG